MQHIRTFIRTSWYRYVRTWTAPWQQKWQQLKIDAPEKAALLRFLSITAISIFFLVGLFLQIVRWGAFGPLPQKSDLRNISHPLAAEVYTADSVLLGRYYLENRSFVRYPNISSSLVEALIATEDARFFDHHGIDFRSWLRVGFRSLLLNQRSAGGGSTITQQLAKNLYPRQDYGKASILINKVKEVLVAKRLERLYSKEEILELYLNTVPFSENTYGIKVAAQRFFSATAASLKPEEAAVLVAMLKATSTYNPRRFPERSKARRNLVLAQMAKYGYLSPEASDTLSQQPLNLRYTPLTNNDGNATHFREHLRLQIKELLNGVIKTNGIAYNLYTDGLKIYTTLDARLQVYAEEAVLDHMPKLQKDFQNHLRGADPWEHDTILLLAKERSERYRQLASECYALEHIDSVFNQQVPMRIYARPGEEVEVMMSPMDSVKYYQQFLNAGFLAADPQTGAIKAWVGGIDHRYFQYDHVRARRQVGSTFKPIVYAAALRAGFEPCQFTPNYLRTYWQYEGWRPKNANDRYGGWYSMEGGLINSVNTIAVQTALRARPQRVAALAEEMGLEQDVPRVPAIALGAVEASLMEMVQVYATFAARGVRRELYYLQRIEDARGTVIWAHALTDTVRQVLDTAHADMINQMLRKATVAGTARRLHYRYQLPNDLAGKTGTSQNHADGWFIGYQPKLVAGTWVGAESPAVRFRNLRLGQGANTALPIFAEFMLRVNRDSSLKKLAETTFPAMTKEVEIALSCPRVQYPHHKEAETNEGVKQAKADSSPDAAVAEIVAAKEES